MNKKKIFNIKVYILFSSLFIYMFYTNSFIRPYAIYNPYKEIVSALIVLSIIFLNYIILIPYFFKKNNYSNYILLSLLLISMLSIGELLLVKSDILKCFFQTESFGISKYLFHILFVIFLRNGALYLFFTILKLYQQSREGRIMDRKIVLKNKGMIIIMPIRGKQIALDIKHISYFSHKKNITFVHRVKRKNISIYSTLSDMQSYLGELCLRLNKENIITYTNIISYNIESVTVKKGLNSKISLFFSKKDAQYILQRLRFKVPHLEEKNTVTVLKNDVFGGLVSQKDDETTKYGGLNALILDEILNNPGINTRELVENLKGKIHLRTLERRLSELKKSGKIKSKRGGKERGYFIV